MLLWCAVVALAAGSAALKMTLVHTNDMHARFVQTDALSGKCSPGQPCYGGFARLATALRRERAGPAPVLFLNAGDTFQGTAWYTVHKWRIAADMLNLLNPDAISLGNHEFDDGVKGLAPFINTVNCPVLAANLDVSDEPYLSGTKLINSTVFKIDGYSIGVIGYLTPETQALASTGNVKFSEEVESINREAKRLVNEGVKILIAVGHSGFEVDKNIAKLVPDIDIVIGGHTNTFLYTGSAPDKEIPEGLYPTEVRQRSGKRVPVVQAYAYTKYLGRLQVEFDDNGNLLSYKGNPLLLDSSIPEAEDVLKQLEYYRPAVDAIAKEVVGTTKVLLDGDSKHCRVIECNFGNFYTDALIYYYAKEYTGPGWTNAPIAILNGGGIRTSIDASSSGGNITREDLLAAFPFSTTAVKFNMKGKHLLKVLENSVDAYDPTGVSSTGAFLQVSGLKITYDVNKPRGQRVKSVLARCGNCSVPKYLPLEDEELYGVLTLNFIYNGGDHYTMIKKYQEGFDFVDYNDIDVVIRYLNDTSPVYPGVDGRIFFDPEPDRTLSFDRVQQGTSASYQLMSCFSFILIPLLNVILNVNML